MINMHENRLFSFKPTVFKPFMTRHAKRLTSQANQKVKKPDRELTKDYSNPKNQKSLASEALVRKTRNGQITHVDALQELYEKVDEICNDIVFEVSEIRSPELDAIENAFAQLKRDMGSSSVNNLVKAIKKFTNIKTVKFFIEKDWDNAGILVYYKDVLPDELNLEKPEKLTKSIKVSKTDVTDLQKLSNIFEELYICFGTKLLNKNTASELTAILLHELGHAYMHTNNFSMILSTFVSIVRKKTYNDAYSEISTPLRKLISKTILTFTRTLYHFDHYEEFKADQFAAAYGYGEELITHEHKSYKQINKNKSARKPFLTRMFSYVKRFFVPEYSHPSERRRICKLISTMKKQYAEHYPELKNEILSISNDLKC